MSTKSFAQRIWVAHPTPSSLSFEGFCTDAVKWCFPHLAFLFSGGGGWVDHTLPRQNKIGHLGFVNFKAGLRRRCSLWRKVAPRRRSIPSSSGKSSDLHVGQLPALSASSPVRTRTNVTGPKLHLLFKDFVLSSSGALILPDHSSPKYGRNDPDEG